MRIKGRPAAGRKPATLCWYCEKAIGGCCWSRYFQPVPGWKALSTVVYHSRSQKGMKSFLVLDCPEFKADMPEEKENRRIRQRFLSRGYYDPVSGERNAPEQRCGTCKKLLPKQGLCTLNSVRTKKNAYQWCHAWEASCRKSKPKSL